jgi:hypothetical protein
MPFPYYDRLSSRDKAIYRRSDEVGKVALPAPEAARPLVEDLRRALASEDRVSIEAAAGGLALALARQLDLPPVGLSVLAVRPSSGGGELHGLYTRDEGRTPRIQLWMRTARHRRVVAFRTFLRTLLHEIGHHIDYEHLGLADSFHTEGFFRRESSLFRQLVPEAEPHGSQDSDVSRGRK